MQGLARRQRPETGASPRRPVARPRGGRPPRPARRGSGNAGRACRCRRRRARAISSRLTSAPDLGEGRLGGASSSSRLRSASARGLRESRGFRPRDRRRRCRPFVVGAHESVRLLLNGGILRISSRRPSSASMALSGGWQMIAAPRGPKQRPTTGRTPWREHLEQPPPRTTCWKASTSPASAFWSPASRPGLASRPPARWPRMARMWSAPRATSPRPRRATEQVRAERGERRRAGAGRARPRLARQRARLRRRAARRRQAVRRDHRQRRRHGDAVGPHRRRLRDPVRHQPPRPFRVRQPHRLADQAPARGW